MFSKECLLFMKKVAVAKKSKIIYQLIVRERHLIIIGYIHNMYKLSIHIKIFWNRENQQLFTGIKINF